MSDFDRNVAARGGFADRAAAVDAGLRAYMIRVYNYMAAAVALTGVVAWFTYNAAVVTDATGDHRLTPFGQTLLQRPGDDRADARRRSGWCSSSASASTGCSTPPR